jgi:hypothetical protein
MNFERWLISTGQPRRTASRYASAIAGVVSSWAAKSGLVKQSLYEITSPDDFAPVAKAIRQLAVYEARNTVTKGIYNAALNAYADYLQSSGLR